MGMRTRMIKLFTVNLICDICNWFKRGKIEFLKCHEHCHDKVNIYGLVNKPSIVQNKDMWANPVSCQNWITLSLRLMQKDRQ